MKSILSNFLLLCLLQILFLPKSAQGQAAEFEEYSRAIARLRADILGFDHSKISERDCYGHRFEN